MKLITRKEALRQGLTRYYTGVPCSHGHDSERFANMSRCIKCHMLRLQAKRRDQFITTPEEYNMMLETQQHKCALCLFEFGTHREYKPVIDHCHVTGEVRALLCRNCNSMLGFARDNPETLKAGAKYLELFMN